MSNLKEKILDYCNYFRNNKLLIYILIIVVIVLFYVFIVC